jgi:hypothetical protein
VHTEDLTVRFGGLPTLNRVNSEASETKGLALDAIAPLTRWKGEGRRERGEVSHECGSIPQRQVH